MRTTTILAFLFCACFFVFNTQAQTETKCDANDQNCLKAEEVAAKSIAKFVATKFVPDTDSLATTAPKSDSDYRLKPTPTPTPADVTAAPAKPASNGSNPAELITRIELKYQFQSFASGYLHGVTIVRGDYAFSPTVSFRADLPILTFDSKTPGAKSESGIGDIVMSMTFVKMFSKKFVGVFAPRIDFPTASHSSLGSGKYTFKPLIAGLTPLGKGLAFVGVLEYHASVGGKTSRADINEVRIKPIILKSFLSGSMKGFYMNPLVEFIVDFETNNRTTLQASLQMGKVLSKNVVLFWGPTFHVAGTKRDTFKMEAGFRYLFR